MEERVSDGLPGKSEEDSDEKNLRMVPFHVKSSRCILIRSFFGLKTSINYISSRMIKEFYNTILQQIHSRIVHLATKLLMSASSPARDILCTNQSNICSCMLGWNCATK